MRSCSDYYFHLVFVSAHPAGILGSFLPEPLVWNKFSTSGCQDGHGGTPKSSEVSHSSFPTRHGALASHASVLRALVIALVIGVVLIKDPQVHQEALALVGAVISARLGTDGREINSARSGATA